MKTPVKNIITILLLLIMAAPLFYAQTMEWNRKSNRREMKQRLKKGMLSGITLAGTDIHWYKPGKEIVIEGHLFDVEKQQLLPDGRTRFTGLFDNKETALNNQLNKHQRNQDQKNSRQLAQFFTDWNALPFSMEEPFNFWLADKLTFTHPEMDPVTAFSSILIPPPRV